MASTGHYDDSAPNNEVLAEEGRVGESPTHPGQRSNRIRTILCPLIKVCGTFLAIATIFGLGLGLGLNSPNRKSDDAAPSSTQNGTQNEESYHQGNLEEGKSDTQQNNNVEEKWMDDYFEDTILDASYSSTETSTDEEEAVVPIAEDINREYPTANDLVSKGIARETDFNDSKSYRSRALEVLNSMGVAAGYSDQKLAQRYALLCLYYSTNRVRTDVTDAQYGYGTTPGWQVISKWKTVWEEDECTYYGIACDTDGLVTRIELTNHLLTGFIPMELELLNNGPILVIDFSTNRGLGEGGFPLVFTKFDSLAVIGLEGCSFAGSVPDEMCGLNTKIAISCGLTCSCCEPCLP